LINFPYLVEAAVGDMFPVAGVEEVPWSVRRSIRIKADLNKKWDNLAECPIFFMDITGLPDNQQNAVTCLQLSPSQTPNISTWLRLPLIARNRK
jgi:hypothetical protein